jgi:hypothetical protein
MLNTGFDHLVDLAGCDSETARSTSLFVSGSRDGGVSNKRPPKKTYFKEMDRLFSLSSVTSPVFLWEKL